MSDDVKKQHVSSNQIDSWTNHIGSSGTESHPLGNGSSPGFSTNDFSNTRKETLDKLNKNVGNTRITIGPNAPSNPIVNNELWINSNSKFIAIYTDKGWEFTGAYFK